MSTRKVRSNIIVVATNIANVDSVDTSAPGGAAYAAHMLRNYADQVLLIASVLEDESRDLFDGMAGAK